MGENRMLIGGPWWVYPPRPRAPSAISKLREMAIAYPIPTEVSTQQCLGRHPHAMTYIDIGIIPTSKLNDNFVLIKIKLNIL